MREAQDLPDDFYEIYVVDPAFHLLGAVALDKILRTRRAEKVTSIMTETRHAVLATEDQEEVARMFERYNLVSSAVVDENDRLVGVLTVDDIVDVISVDIAVAGRNCDPDSLAGGRTGEGVERGLGN